MSKHVRWISMNSNQILNSTFSVFHFSRLYIFIYIFMCMIQTVIRHIRFRTERVFNTRTNEIENTFPNGQRIRIQERKKENGKWWKYWTWTLNMWMNHELSWTLFQHCIFNERQTETWETRFDFDVHSAYCAKMKSPNIATLNCIAHRTNARLGSPRAKYRIKFDFQLTCELRFGYGIWLWIHFQPHLISKTKSHQPKLNKLSVGGKMFVISKNYLSFLDERFRVGDTERYVRKWKGL